MDPAVTEIWSLTPSACKTNQHRMVDTACPPQVPTQNVLQTVGVVPTCSVPVAWNPTQEEESSSQLTSPPAPRRSTAVLSTTSTFSLQSETVARAALSLPLGSNSSLKLQLRRGFFCFWRCRNSGCCPVSICPSRSFPWRVVPDSTLHFRALWRLYKSWLLAVPPEFRTPVNFKIALAAAVLATVSGAIELGPSFVGMFHFLLRRGEWREVTWSDYQVHPTSLEFRACAPPKRDANRFPPKSSTCSSSVQVWPSCSKLFNFVLRLLAASLSLVWLSAKDARFQAVLRRLGLVDSPFTLAGFLGSGGTDHFFRCRDIPGLRRRGRWSSEKTPERYVQEGVHYLESLSFPTHVVEWVAELSNFAPQLSDETATALLARLPPQHLRQTSGKGSGGSCLSRHRAQCEGGETELYLGAVSEHFDLNSCVDGTKTKDSYRGCLCLRTCI